MKRMKKCRVCWWGMLRQPQALENWLAETLGAEFRYQWSVRDQLGRQEPFRVVHPDQYRRWLEQGPCVDCPCEKRCDEICALRARWWDARIGRLQARFVGRSNRRAPQQGSDPTAAGGGEREGSEWQRSADDEGI